LSVIAVSTAARATRDANRWRCGSANAANASDRYANSIPTAASQPARSPRVGASARWTPSALGALSSSTDSVARMRNFTSTSPLPSQHAFFFYFYNVL